MKLWPLPFNIALLTSFLTTAGCVSRYEGKEMRDELFSVETRVLEIEKALESEKSRVSQGERSQSQKLASTSANFDKLQLELQQIRGELDILKEGIKSGRLPGVDSVDGEVTVASRIEALETQAQLFDERVVALESVPQNRGKAVAKAAQAPQVKPTASNLSDLQSLFTAQKFKEVVASASQVEKAANKSELARVKYLHAESLYKLNRIQDAALKFNELTEGPTPKEIVPDLKMRLGDCFRRLGDVETARIYYQELIDQYPKTAQAEKARERVAVMKKPEKGKGDSAG